MRCNFVLLLAAIATPLIIVDVADAELAPGIYNIGTLNNQWGVPRSWPRALTPDGSIAVGGSTTNYPWTSEAFVWQSGTLTGLGDAPGNTDYPYDEPFSVAHDLSPDGRYVVGSATWDYGTSPAIWVDGEGPYDINILTSDSHGGVAMATSANLTIVGQKNVGQGNQAFVWGGNLSGLGDLPGGEFESIANDITPDASVIVGTGHSEAGQEAFVYKNGMMTGLGDLPGGNFGSRANAVSADGSTIVGWGTSGTSIYAEASIWRDGVITGLGDLPGAEADSQALAVSGDGSVVVGLGISNQGCGSCGSAFIWDDTNGMRFLDDVLTEDYGIDLDGWFLEVATAISDDGQTIAGIGYNSNDRSYATAFVVRLPEPGTLSFVTIVAMVVFKRRTGLR